jgi:predicted nucleotidyltransferase component of viral defense system
MSKAIEQSIKEKLKNISKKEGVAFNALLETLFLERFMVRVAKSQHRENLVFKGGMCLAQYLVIGRETRDLDFLVQKVVTNETKIREMFIEISSIKNEDGIVFEVMDVGLLSIEHKKYPGYRLSIQGNLGQVKQKVSVDVGVGDVVRPRLLDVELLHDKGPLFEYAVTLNAYPPEYIFAEKLEAIIHLGESNSRMKDFFDCYQMIQDKNISKEDFKEAILAIFANRGTKVGLVPDFAELLETRWNGFARLNKITDLKLDTTIRQINVFLNQIGVS